LYRLGSIIGRFGSMHKTEMQYQLITDIILFTLYTYMISKIYN